MHTFRWAALAAVWLGSAATAHPPVTYGHDAYKGPLGTLSCEVRYGFYPTVWQPWCAGHPVVMAPAPVLPPAPSPSPNPTEPLSVPPKVNATPARWSPAGASPYQLAAPLPGTRR
jgi:hypothetical protein